MSASIIVLSREVCTGGCDVGKKAAQALGIPYYDKELISMAARESGLSEEAVAANEQRRTGSLLYSLYAMTAELPLGDQVFLAQSQVIRKLAQRGPCVIVGRCGDYVLRDFAGVLRVMVHAPMEFRRRYARTVLGWTGEDKELDTRLYKQDKARASYYEYYTQNRWGDVRHCDLALNAALGEDACVEALLAAYRTAEIKK